MHTDVAKHACMHDIALNTSIVKVKIKVSLHAWDLGKEMWLPGDTIIFLQRRICVASSHIAT